MKPANYAPMYCALYPQLAEISRKHGYALAIHGSLGRDMDLVCIPWAEEVGEPSAVVDDITGTFAINKVGELTPMKHGRLCQTISVGFGDCFLDLSFMPRTKS